MLKVGLTGGIGSGKTTIAKMFEVLGIPIYYADIEAKKLMRSNKILKSKIKRLLSDEAYHSNGYPNRSYIAKLVFSDKLLLEGLNSIVHPAVQSDLDIWFAERGEGYGIYESAILLESGASQSLDCIITVSAPEDLRISRVAIRDKSSIEQVQKRIENQLSDQEREQRSDYVVYNGSDDQLIPQVYELHQILLKLCKN